MAIVYKLINPINDVVYYVGFTKLNLLTRLGGHIREGKHPTTKMLIEREMMPSIEILEEGENVTTQTEKYWIKKLSDEGHPLENSVGYRDGGKKYDRFQAIKNKSKSEDETRLRIALQQILDELPISPSIPIVRRIKSIAQSALSV